MQFNQFYTYGTVAMLLKVYFIMMQHPSDVNTYTLHLCYHSQKQKYTCIDSLQILQFQGMPKLPPVALFVNVLQISVVTNTDYLHGNYIIHCKSSLKMFYSNYAR